MKKDILKKLEIIIVVLLGCIMVSVPYAHYKCIVNGLYYSHIAEIMYRYFMPCALIIICCVCVQIKNIQITWYEKLFTVLLLVLFINLRTALDPVKAIKGESGRNEGLIMLLCYYLFFYIARFVTAESNRKLVINIFLVVMTLHSLYGIGQFYELDISFIHDYFHYAISGVAGNPNFMGSLMVMACGVCIGMAVYSEKTYSKIIYFSILPILGTALIFTKTMSAYVGLASIVFTLSVFITVNIYQKKGPKFTLFFIGALLITGILSIVIIDKLAYGIVTKEIFNILNQLNGDINWETVASGRFLIWGNILKMLPDYLWFGVGIDGLETPYYEAYGLFNGAFLDKAHNELLQILITMGIFAFICYIVLYILIAIDLKNRIKTTNNKAVDMALLFAFIGYMCQAMFNISVVDVAPYFWILMGLMARPLTKDSQIKQHSKSHP